MDKIGKVMEEQHFHNIATIFEHLTIKEKIRLLRTNKTIRDFLIDHYGGETNFDIMLNEEKHKYILQRQHILELMNKYYDPYEIHNRNNGHQITISDILTILDIIEKEDMNINTLVNNDGQNILMILLAIYKKQLPNFPQPHVLVQRVLSLGIDVNATDKKEKTALPYASGHSIPTIKLLFDAGFKK